METDLAAENIVLSCSRSGWRVHNISGVALLDSRDRTHASVARMFLGVAILNSLTDFGR